MSILNNVKYLNVPFEEKEQAKSLGAKWDATNKSWYIPKGESLDKFERWLPNEKLNLEEHCQKLVSPVYVVKSSCPCWKCDHISQVICIAANGFSDHEMDLRDFVTFSNVTFMSEKLQSYINESFKLYKPSYSKTAGGVYYMNHCEHCGAKMGDFFMHNEPGGAFHPVNKHEGEMITLIELPYAERCYFLLGNEGVRYPCFISEYASRLQYNENMSLVSKKSGGFIQKLTSMFISSTKN